MSVPKHWLMGGWYCRGLNSPPTEVSTRYIYSNEKEANWSYYNYQLLLQLTSYWRVTVGACSEYKHPKVIFPSMFVSTVVFEVNVVETVCGYAWM